MPYRRTAQGTRRLYDRRRRILEAGRSLLSEGGFEAAKIASVAAAAGVATGTVYRYFPSKADLFRELVSQVSRTEIAVVRDVSTSDASAPERLSRAVYVFSRRALRARTLAYALIAEPVDPEIDSARLHYRAALAAVFQALIEEGQDDGVFDTEVDAAIGAACIVGALIEALVGPLSPDREASEHPEALSESIARFVTRAALASNVDVQRSSSRPA